MPTYDYKCSQCGSVFEKFHNMTENPEVQCPECDAPAVKMIGAGAGIVFKGSGFYVNDYKKKDDKTAKAKNGANSSPDSSTSKSEPSSSPAKEKAEKKA